MNAALLLAAVLCLAVAAPAAAQEDEPASPTARLATVSFLDDQPFTKTWVQLTADDGLAVTVRNEQMSSQKVTLVVLGAPGFRRLETPSIAGRAIRRLVVPLTGDRPPDGSYSAVVVATGESGALARRRFTLTVDAVAAPARARALSAADISDQTLPATNFAPSPLATWGPMSMVLILGGLLFLTIALWGRNRAQLKRHDAIPAVVVLILLGGFVAGTLGHTFGNRDDQRGASLVSAKSLPVAGVADGTYGVVTDDEADIGSLDVEANRLSVEGLRRAGAYTGKLDLTPGVEKGDATVKVNVRDWWVWPFLLIAAGVLVGYLVRRFFQHRLPRDRLIADAYRVGAEASKISLRSSAYSIERPVADETRRIVALAGRDLAGATTALATLRTNLDAYSRMALVLKALRRRLAKARWRARQADVTHGPMERFEKAEELLADPLVAFDKTEYDERVQLAGKADDDLEAVIRDDTSVRGMLEQAAAMKIAFPKLREKLTAIEERLTRLRRDVFLSDAASVDTAISACRKELLDLAGEPEHSFQEFQLEEGQAAGGSAASAAEGAVPMPDYAEADRAVRAAERRGSLVAGTLAVASGLSTLYFADGVWGTPGDYLAALLWGAAVAEGLKYVKAIADRKWAE